MKKYLLIFLMLFVTGCGSFSEFKKAVEDDNVYSKKCINLYLNNRKDFNMSDHEILLYITLLENCTTRELIEGTK